MPEKRIITSDYHTRIKDTLVNIHYCGFFMCQPYFQNIWNHNSPSKLHHFILRTIILLICGALSLLNGLSSHASTTIGGDEMASMNMGVASGTNIAGAGTPDLFTGAMSYSVPINVPPGRAGMNPIVAMTYRSDRGNGWLGVGWDLSVGSITRNTKFGLNYNGDDYVLDINGAMVELVYTGTVNSYREYRAKIEGAFFRVQQIPHATQPNAIYWKVTGRAGKIYIFGGGEGNDFYYYRQSKPGFYTTDTTYRWYLTSIADTRGNMVEYQYGLPTGELYSNHGQYYLKSILYTSKPGLKSPSNTINFYVTPRSDDVVTSYTLGYPVKTAYKLATIDITANNGINRVRTYKLSYTTSPSTKRSLLSNLWQYGKDASVDPNTGLAGAPASSTQIPPITFEWQSGDYEISHDAFTLVSQGTGDPTLGRQWADANGDGRGDYCFVATSSVKCYLSTGNTFNTSPITSGTIDIGYFVVGRQFVDFNGDGKSDYCRVYAPNGSLFSQYLQCTVSTGTGFGTTYTSTTVLPGSVSDYDRVWVDFNGDGNADYCRVTIDNTVACTISTGTGFGQEYTSSALNIGSTNAGRQWADFNGDGKADFCRVSGNANALGTLYCTVSTGTGFGSTYSPSVSVYLGQDSGREWTDYNGDGRADYCRVDGFSNNPATLRCTLSTGTGFDTNTSYESLPLDAGLDKGRAWVDVNRDGRSDYCRLTGSSSTTYSDIKCTVAGIYGSYGFNETYSMNLDGRLFYVGETWLGSNNSDSVAYQWIDFDGDSTPDFCRAYQNTFILGVYNLGCWTTGTYTEISDSPGDLLQTVDNGVLGTTTITYTPSTQYQNTQLPFNLWTVGKFTVDDGKLHVGTSEYEYQGGIFNIPERDFRGFGYTKVTGEADQSGNRLSTETWYYQARDNIANNPTITNAYDKGKPYSVIVRDAIDPNYHYSESLMSYTAVNVGPSVFSPLTSSTTRPCDRGICWKESRINYIYDCQVTTLGQCYGNIVVEQHENDRSVTNDDVTITRSYLPNTSSWIVGAPYLVRTFKGLKDLNNPTLSGRVAETLFYFDSPDNCDNPGLGGSAQPIYGQVTYTSQWLPGASYSVESYNSYDSYGNLHCTRDPNGNISYIFYDSLLMTFPLTFMNPKNHITTTQYYGVNGAPADNGLYGQVKGVTDPNNALTTSQYDSHGRPVLVTMPEGKSIQTTYDNIGTTLQSMTKTTSTGLFSTSYFDGLGRAYETRETGPNGSDIITKTLYDNQGKIQQVSLPYFYNDTAFYKTFSYDPTGRVTQVVNPDGTHALTCYNNWTTTYVDINKHKRRETRDPAGRLLQVDEFSGIYTTCDPFAGTIYATTSYEYDVLGNLIKVTDDKGNITTMKYDSLSRKIGMSDPDMGSCGDLTVLNPSSDFPWYDTPCWNYEYDPNGNLLTQQDAKGQRISFTYDALNRLKTKEFGVIYHAYNPPVISNVTSSNITATSADINWVTDIAADTQVDYGLTTNYDSSTTQSTNLVTDHSASITELLPATLYHYRVKSQDEAGNMAVSEDYTFTTSSIQPIIDQDFGTYNTGTYVKSSYRLGQTFTTASTTTNISAVDMVIDLRYWTSGEVLTMTLWDSPARDVNLGSKTLADSEKNSTFTFDTPIPVSPGTQYYFELTHNGGGNNSVGWIGYRSYGGYAGGSAYFNGSIKSYDFDFTTYTIPGSAPPPPPPPPPPPGVPLTQGKPATASGQYTSNIAANAVDGDTGTLWNAGGYAPQWIYVDLGAVMPISQVKVLAGTGSPAGTTAYDIQVTNDLSSAWSTIESDANASTTDFTTTPVSTSARYVRIYIKSHSGGSWIALYELQVY